MYATYNQTIEAAQRWFNMAIEYQTRAVKLATNLSNPHDYPESVFYYYRGYARCMQMYDACWSHIDAMNSAYFRKRDYEEKRSYQRLQKAAKEVKSDEKLIRIMFYLVSAFIGFLFADVWLSFIEWLAPHLI